LKLIRLALFRLGVFTLHNMATLFRSESKVSTDSDTLALLGKKQVLKRRFGFWSLLAFAVCELITWETVLALFGQGLDNGGPAGLVFGFLIAWLSTLYVCNWE
jgi:choline transport protein